MNRIIHPLTFALLLVSSLSMAAQTCNPNIPLDRPDSRYTDNGDGTVTDLVTGLIWKQCAEGLSTTAAACDTGSAATFTWQEALERAQSVGFAFHNDWRLPNFKELMSLVESACAEPAINLTLFPFTPSSIRFWSSTPVRTTPNSAQNVGFGSGYNGPSLKDNTYHVRLVRAGG